MHHKTAMPTAKPRTILLIDDSAEDRAVYCRYLERWSVHPYQVLEASSAAMGLDLYQRLLPDAILLDYSLPDMDGLEFLAVMQQAGKRVPVLLLIGQDDGRIAAQAIKSGAQDYLTKGHMTADGLCKALDRVIEQFQLQQRLQQQEEQQQILSAIALRIRQTLTLQTILDTSVAEVRQYLSADRVLIYQFAPDMSGQIVAEAVLPEWFVSLNVQVEDTCFRQNLGGDYRLGRTRAIDNIDEAGLTNCHIQLLKRFQVKANLVVPLLITNPHSDSAEPHHDAALPQLWGLLVVHQCAATRQWQAFEIELLNQVAVQMAIAIQQSIAYQQVQAELAKRQRIEAVLRKSEQRYATLTEMAPVGIFQTDALGNCLYVNERWCQIAGLSPEDAADFGWVNGIHPDDRELVSTEWYTAAQANRPFYLEYRFQNAAGQITWVLGQAVAERDVSGVIVGYVGTITDISDRKQTEIALSRLAALVESSADAIIGKTLEGVILSWNKGAENLFGYTAAEAIGQSLLLLAPAGFEHEEEAILERLKRGVPLEHHETVRRHKDGRLIDVSLTISPIKNATGTIIGTSKIARDITDRKQAEAERLQAEQIRNELKLLESILDNILAGYWDADLVSHRQYISPGFKRMFGYEDDELPNSPETWKQLVLPEDLPKALDGYARHIKSHGEIPYYSELRYRHKDGSIVWVICTGQVVAWDAAGNPLRLIGCHIDITDRKQAEEQLRKSDAHLKTAQRIGKLGSWEFDLRTEQITWSEEVFRIFGRDPKVGAPSFESLQQQLHPDDRDRHQQTVQTAIATVQPYSTEYRLYRPDGTLRYIQARGEPVVDAANQIVQLVGTVLDLTERRQAEEDLRNLSNRLTLAIQSGAIAIWDWNVAENILIWDDRMYELYGITPDAFTSVYEAWSSSLHPDDRPFAEAAIQKALTGEKDYDPEFRVIHPDGTIHFIKAYALVLRNEQGEPRQMIGINYDITDRKQAERDLKQLTIDLQRSNQELEQFAYVASHDLQEPLRAITSYTQLLAKRYQGQLDEKADKYIYYVVDGAARMQQLIQDLLTYSRVGRYELKRQPTDCNAVVERVRNDLQVAIAESSAVITVDALPTILADTAQVTQLFQNLIGNALKYRGQAAPSIKISARQQGKEWAFSIQDNGIGIEPQYAERIFEIFQRLHTRREYEGTGLGLAICKKIVARHHGRLWVESQLGQGATFYFTLPASLNDEYYLIKKE